MILRVKTKVGRLVINNLTEESTLENLQKVLEKKTSIPPNSQRILCGYPPKQILSSDPQSTLHSLHIKSGETLIFEELSDNDNKKRTLAPETPSEVPPTGGLQAEVIDLTNDSTLRESDTNVQIEGVPRREMTEGGQSQRMAMKNQLKRKIVAADNSCLFRTVSILLCDDREGSRQLRELIGGIVLSDPGKYNTALLGRNNQEYVDWLLKEESWGGAIEVSIFSDHYQTELDVVDIQTQRIDKFGEDRGYSSRVLLLYDGIHYDALVIERADGSVIQTVFPTTDDTVLIQAVQIAKDAFQARQFTDLAGFTLRCLVCGKALTGQTDAQSHAKLTGHINFGEV